MNLFKKLPIRIINAGLILLIVVLLLVPVLYSYQTILLRIDDSLLETNARNVLLKIDNLEATLLDAETGQRGYIITGNEKYLEPYNRALLTVDKDFEDLKSIVKNPAQQELLLEIQPLVKEKINILKENIDINKDNILEASKTMVLKVEGKEVMDLIRKNISDLRDAQNKILEERIVNTQEATDLTLYILFWGTILALIFYIIINYIIDRFVIEGLVKKPAFERERLLLESVGDGVISINRSFKITLFNKVATKLTGFTAEEAIGKPFRDIIKFIKTDTRKDNIVFIEEAMLYGEIKYMESPTSLIRKDGQEIPIGDSASPVFNPSGEVDGCIVVFRDMSKELELEKVKDDFTFRIVHDLRSPLTVMKSVLEDEELVKNLELKPELKESYYLLNESTKKMLGMVNDLLTTTKSQKTGSPTKKVAVTEIINDIVRNLKPVALDRKINFAYAITPGIPTISVPDSEKINEVFTNLLNNSIKYSKEGGVITITHETEGRFLKTNIQDTGIGISPENLKKIFVPYSRVNEREGAEGTGLGLSIVKKLVEDVGGKVQVSSREGIGSIFSVYLPI